MFFRDLETRTLAQYYIVCFSMILVAPALNVLLSQIHSQFYLIVILLVAIVHFMFLLKLRHDPGLATLSKFGAAGLILITAPIVGLTATDAWRLKYFAEKPIRDLFWASFAYLGMLGFGSAFSVLGLAIILHHRPSN
jgi:hypothetical protein